MTRAQVDNPLSRTPGFWTARSAWSAFLQAHTERREKVAAQKSAEESAPRSSSAPSRTAPVKGRKPE